MVLSGDAKTVVVGRGEQIQNFTTKIVHFGKNTEGEYFKTWCYERKLPLPFLMELVKLNMVRQNQMQSKNLVY